jgi:hypothetical protein
MKREQERTEMINTLTEQATMKYKNIKAREYTTMLERNRKWEQDLFKKEAEMKKETEKLMAAAQARAEAGKRRRRGKKGKGKKK